MISVSKLVDVSLIHQALYFLIFVPCHVVERRSVDFYLLVSNFPDKLLDIRCNWEYKLKPYYLQPPALHALQFRGPLLPSSRGRIYLCCLIAERLNFVAESATLSENEAGPGNTRSRRSGESYCEKSCCRKRRRAESELETVTKTSHNLEY